MLNLYLAIVNLYFSFSLPHFSQNCENILIYKKNDAISSGYFLTREVKINPFSPVPSFNINIPDTSDLKVALINELKDTLCFIEKLQIIPGEYSITWSMKINENKYAPKGNYYYQLNAINSSRNFSQKYTVEIKFLIPIDLN
ncbi:MAG: hypothetical protein IAE65_09430 [Ignavibacteria bacterium]|nr:hypothetical protein [Ignavibacteria bacterium]